MLETMTAAGEGTGRTQPINGLDELLPGPGKTGKAARALPDKTGAQGISSFTQLLTEGLLSLTTADRQSLPPGEAEAWPADAADKPVVDRNVLLTAVEGAPWPPSVAAKAVMEGDSSLPVVQGIVSSLTISPFNIALSSPGDASASGEGVDKTLAPGDGAVIATGIIPSVSSSQGLFEPNKLSGEKRPTKLITDNKIEDMGTKPQIPTQREQSETVASVAPPLITAAEIIAERAMAVSATLKISPEKTTAGPQAVKLPGEASRGSEAISGAEPQIPLRWAPRSAEGTPTAKHNGVAPPLIPVDENITDQAMAISATLEMAPEKTIAGQPAVKLPGEASRGAAEAIRGVEPQTPPQSEGGALVAKSYGLAASLPGVENIIDQTVTLAATLNALPGKTTGSAKQALETIEETIPEKVTIGLAGRQSPPEKGRLAEAGAAPSQSNRVAPAPLPAAEDITRDLTVESAAFITTSEKTTAVGQQAVKLPGEINRGPETIILPELQPSSPRVSQSEASSPPVKINGSAPALVPVVENETDQATALAAENNAPPAKTTVPGRQAVESVGATSPEKATIMAGRQSLPEWGRKPEAGATPGQSDIAVPAPLPAADHITPALTIEAAVSIAQPAKATAAGRPVGEPVTEASREREAISTGSSRELLLRTGLDGAETAKSDVRQGSVLSDKGKAHPPEPFTPPELMDMKVNMAGVLPGKGQDTAVPAASLLAQVAEQLPQAVSKGSGRVRIRLEPDNLGKLDMDLVVRENKVQIILTAESRIVQQTLQGHGEQLKDALQQRGLEMDGFNVLLQNGRQGQGDMAGNSNPFWSEYNRAAADKKAAGNDNFLTAATPLGPGQSPKKGAEGINIFV